MFSYLVLKYRDIVRNYPRLKVYFGKVTYKKSEIAFTISLEHERSRTVGSDEIIHLNNFFLFLFLLRYSVNE